MKADPTPADPASLEERIRELEARLRESEDTVEAIRCGDIDAVVVSRQAEEYRIYTLDSADRPYRILIEHIQEGAVTLADDGSVLYCNRRLARMLGVPHERLVGQRLQPFVCPEDAAAFDRLIDEAKHAGARREFTFLTANGTQFPVYISLNVLQRDGGTALLCGVLSDLTEQKLRTRELADSNARLLAQIAERERVEDTLRQAQKMEAVGQLTGGLAHDFNNLLTGIAGSLELMQARVAEGRFGDVNRYLTAAQGAASRAASLTHRLLAFSRRQTLDPVPTNANRLVAEMEELLKRTMGPAIVVRTVLAAGLWPTLCDPNQLENAVLNLSINARDAMPDGGSLTIETANVRLDERAARERDMAPGQYVTVSVADTGTGMSPDVVTRAFDPFFTTKPIGTGTGLGLSMIYGFARQSGGQARIDSVPGQGTTVRLYLPRHATEEASTDEGEAAAAPLRTKSGETILVVDDESTVRMLVSDVLGGLGYATIEAADGPAGLQIAQSCAKIDLLITDVGLPGGVNGREVADAARKRRPKLKVLFITGYGDDAATANRPLDGGTQVMTKPFAMTALAAKVQLMLNES